MEYIWCLLDTTIIIPSQTSRVYARQLVTSICHAYRANYIIKPTINLFLWKKLVIMIRYYFVYSLLILFSNGSIYMCLLHLQASYQPITLYLSNKNSWTAKPEWLLHFFINTVSQNYISKKWKQKQKKKKATCLYVAVILIQLLYGSKNRNGGRPRGWRFCTYSFGKKIK